MVEFISGLTYIKCQDDQITTGELDEIVELERRLEGLIS